MRGRCRTVSPPRPRCAGESGVGQSFDDGGEQERWDLEVEHRLFSTCDRCAHPSVRGVVREVALHIGHPVGQPAEHLVIEFFARSHNRVPGPLNKLVLGPVLECNADDGAVDQPRRSSRYNDRNVITFARSPVIPKTTKTSHFRGASVTSAPLSVWSAGARARPSASVDHAFRRVGIPRPG